MAKRPVRKPDESTKEYRARLAKWEAGQVGRTISGAARAAGNFLMSKPKVGKADSSLTAWRRNDEKGVSSVTGRKTEKKKTETKTEDKPKSTPRKVSYPVQRGKVEEKPKTTSSSSSSSSSGSSGGSSSSSSSSSTPPRRKPPTAPPPVPKGIVEKTADRYKAKAKKVKERKTYLQSKEGGGLSKRMSGALADKDALKFKPSEDKPKRKPVKANRSKWRR